MRIHIYIYIYVYTYIYIYTYTYTKGPAENKERFGLPHSVSRIHTLQLQRTFRALSVAVLSAAFAAFGHVGIVIMRTRHKVLRLLEHDGVLFWTTPRGFCLRPDGLRAMSSLFNWAGSNAYKVFRGLDWERLFLSAVPESGLAYWVDSLIT